MSTSHVTLDGRADAALRHSEHLIETLFGPPRARSFDVRYWDGTLERGTRAPFTLVLRRPGALRRMLLPPTELAIAEAYLAGDVDVEGELDDAVTLADAITERVRSPRVLASLARDLFALPKVDHDGAGLRERRAERTVERAGSPHDKARDREAIHYHYDVGNDFYRLFLDERMVYSCAYFRSRDDTLDDAQRAKLDLVCRKLRLRPGDRLLDIGCGWGALVMHAAAHYGVRAVGVTLSTQQAALARERIAAAGLDDRCHVEIRDYRDLGSLGAFDKIASVGMIEHVGPERLPQYFDCAYAALRPGGVFLNHGIVSMDEARAGGLRDAIERRLFKRGAFIEQYVFPDGTLTPYASVIAAAERAGFETRDAESLREHYALTLGHWTRRLSARAREAIALVGEPTFRVWRLYMTASCRRFRDGHLNVVQTLLSKADRGASDLPLTRDDLLAPAH